MHFSPHKVLSLFEVFGGNSRSALELLLGQKMSVQLFPQLLSTHKHTHTPTHLYFLTALCVHRVNGVIQESEVLAILRLTLCMLVGDKVLSNGDTCGDWE